LSLCPRQRGRDQSKAFGSTVLDRSGDELASLPRRQHQCAHREPGRTIVGAIQFYNLHTYELILLENSSLRPDQEIGRRYTPDEPPLVAEKRRL
jgi:hypothetical protein